MLALEFVLIGLSEKMHQNSLENPLQDEFFPWNKQIHSILRIFKRLFSSDEPQHP